MESKLDPVQVLNYKPKDVIISYSDSKPILYALGIGFSSDPLKEEDFKFTYELAHGFTTFPTFSSVVDIFALFDQLAECPGFPKFNESLLLHGEQSTQILNPLPVQGTFLMRKRFEDVQDKGKGVLLITSQTIYDPHDLNKVYAINTSRFFIIGLGGFLYKAKHQSLKFPKIPRERKPDRVWEHKTREDQGMLYRLNGDRNPHNIDPKIAAKGNFKRPILHGLCYYGITARAVYESYCEGEPSKFGSFQARFTSIVFPGETLVVKMFKMEGGKVLAHTSTKERGKIVLIAVCELKQGTQPKI